MGPIFSDAPAFIGDSAGSCRMGEQHVWLSRFDVRRQIETREGLSYDFIGSIAFHHLGAGIPRFDDPFRIHHENGIVLNAFKQQPKRIFILSCQALVSSSMLLSLLVDPIRYKAAGWYAGPKHPCTACLN